MECPVVGPLRFAQQAEEKEFDAVMTVLESQHPHFENSLLHGAEGGLVLLRITAGARQLEEVLETIAALPFPINPEIQHGDAGMSFVEFPAYSTRVEEVRGALLERGFPASILRVVEDRF
ncbi:MAG: hypothetical protein JST65_15255 [Acidobacteria bacterium]|nr:hypothetical protein [Acidobacteriota bacterium]